MIAALTAQTGPGGVGNSSNNVLWLDASSLSLNDDDKISTWTDLSGNGNNAFQVDTANQPTYKFSQLNGHPAILFDGLNDFLTLSNQVNSPAITTYIVFNSTNTRYQSVLALNKHHTSYGTNTSRYEFGGDKVKVDKDINGFSITSTYGGSTLPSTSYILNDSRLNSKTRTSFSNIQNNSLGALYYNNSFNFFLDGSIVEILVYNEKLNSAKRKIVSEYLSGKYNITSEANLYNYKSNFGISIKGIGQEPDGSHTISRGTDSLLLTNPSSLNDGDYLIVGSNGADYSTSNSVPVSIVERWNHVWRVDKTGTPGTVDLEFFLGSNGFSSINNYVVVIENEDGDFSNGGTIIHETGRSFNAGSLSIKFTDVDLPDGSYFTLAEKEGTITSVQSGDWNTPSTWSCNCVPESFNDVEISNGDEVSVSSKSNIRNLVVSGSLAFNTNDTLDVYGDITFNNSLTLTNGVIQTKDSVYTQYFTNNSGDTISFNSLIVANQSGLSLSNGNWSLIRSLQVSSGGFDVSGANSFTLISNASTTAEILPSMEDAFTGEFTVQRHISNRRANYSNQSSPISDATVADLDDEDDIIISGVGGNDGDILLSDNSTFYSLFFFDAPNNQHNSIQSTATTLPSAIGYELYLLTTPSYFNGATIDYKGLPNNGSYSTPVYWRWNLVGNPYASHIDYDLTSKHRSIKDEYMVFNSTTGTYDLFTGAGKPLIAPGQGFWVYSSADYANGRPINFDEDDKVSSSSSTFKRRKYIDPYFSLKINNNQNPFSHKMRLAFDPFATAEMDENDFPHLPSPIEEAPAIHSKATNSNEELIVNSLNPIEESQLIPVSIYAGVEGEYEISADNLDALYENYSCVYLKDKDAEKAVDLMVEPKYSFEAKQGKSDRFHLVLSNSYEECQELLKEGEFVQDFDQKLSLRNAYDNWYVDYTLGKEMTQLEIRVYNMSGQEVKAPMSFEAQGAGTYSLQHLNDLEGVYLIQIVGEDTFLNKQMKL